MLFILSQVQEDGSGWNSWSCNLCDLATYMRTFRYGCKTSFGASIVCLRDWDLSGSSPVIGLYGLCSRNREEPISTGGHPKARGGLEVQLGEEEEEYRTQAFWSSQDSFWEHKVRPLINHESSNLYIIKMAVIFSWSFMFRICRLHVNNCYPQKYRMNDQGFLRVSKSKDFLTFATSVKPACRQH